MTAVLDSDTGPDTRPRAEVLRELRAAVDVIGGVPPFGPRPLATLVWDDGIRHVVRTQTVFGRNPGAVPGWAAVAVRDETLSLSRTHIAIGGVLGAVWLADTGSMNGTDIVRDGERHRVAPGERWMLRAGDILEVGDRRVSIEGV
ncbi:FHA domain-containing protein [Microbacterium sp. LjRoot45]|uniref:FHA domain-containing protein n=1 Tax=Microbacterium sp. LjRoot45 TaxID=3342329 RepID=UPI003ED151AD